MAQKPETEQSLVAVKGRFVLTLKWLYMTVLELAYVVPLYLLYGLEIQSDEQHAISTTSKPHR